MPTPRFLAQVTETLWWIHQHEEQRTGSWSRLQVLHSLGQQLINVNPPGLLFILLAAPLFNSSSLTWTQPLIWAHFSPYSSLQTQSPVYDGSQDCSPLNSGAEQGRAEGLATASLFGLINQPSFYSLHCCLCGSVQLWPSGTWTFSWLGLRPSPYAHFYVDGLQNSQNGIFGDILLTLDPG